MRKSINFFGQPIYGQLIKSLDREKIVEMSRAFRGRFCDPPRNLAANSALVSGTPGNEPHAPRKVLRPPESLPHTPRWFTGPPEMSRTVAGSLRELRKQALFELFQIITVR